MSKLQRLRDNIAAISHAMTSTSEYNTDVLDKYTGFGGLGFVLNPLDRSKWSKRDLDCYDDTVSLYELLKEESSSEKEYNKLVQHRGEVLVGSRSSWRLLDAQRRVLLRP